MTAGGVHKTQIGVILTKDRNFEKIGIGFGKECENWSAGNSGF
jgi:hypothetical protein